MKVIKSNLTQWHAIWWSIIIISSTIVYPMTWSKIIHYGIVWYNFKQLKAARLKNWSKNWWNKLKYHDNLVICKISKKVIMLATAIVQKDDIIIIIRIMRTMRIFLTLNCFAYWQLYFSDVISYVFLQHITISDSKIDKLAIFIRLTISDVYLLFSNFFLDDIVK